MEIRIPYKVVQEGREFANKVHNLRGGNIDKFKIKSNEDMELKADIKGFEVEFANCYAFKIPYPKLFEGKQVDDFDCWLATPYQNGLLRLLKFDVKTSDNFLINKEQFGRKKIDAYLFESLKFVDCKADMIFLKIHGWIEKKDVENNSELIKFNNGSEAFKVDKKALKNASFLFSLNQPGGI